MFEKRVARARRMLLNTDEYVTTMRTWLVRMIHLQCARCLSEHALIYSPELQSLWRTRACHPALLAESCSHLWRLWLALSSCSAVSPFQAGLRGQETPASMPFLGTAYNSNCMMLGLHCGFYLLRGSLQGWSWSCWTFTAGWVLLVPPAPSLSIPDHKFLLWSCVVLRSASGESNLLGCELPHWQTEHSGPERESIFPKPHSSVKFQSQTHWPPTEGSECPSGMSLVVQSLRLGLPTQSMWFDP